MSISAFQTRKLLTVVQEMIEPFTPFQSWFFGSREIQDTEYVDLDKDNVGLKMATFVEPDATERPTEKKSFEVHTFRIPYLKPMMTIEPKELRERLPGETIYTDSTMGSRGQMLAVRSLKDLDMRIQRRIEVMSAQLADTGIIPILDSDGHTLRASVVFPRDADTNQTLLLTDRWSDAASDPIEDIENMQDISSRLTGFMPNIAWMAQDVWTALRNNVKFMALLDNRSSTEFAQLTSMATELGIRFVGTVMGLPLYVITTQYGSTKLVPDARFGMGYRGAGHKTLYGPIHDFNENGDVIVASAPRFPSSWTTRNPAVLNLQLHSAPLPFTENWNSFVVWTVI